MDKGKGLTADVVTHRGTNGRRRHNHIVASEVVLDPNDAIVVIDETHQVSEPVSLQIRSAHRQQEDERERWRNSRRKRRAAAKDAADH
jgi:hypothetical protein